MVKMLLPAMLISFYLEDICVLDKPLDGQMMFQNDDPFIINILYTASQRSKPFL